MNNIEINTILSCHEVTKDLFKGVYSKDTLKYISARPPIVVCNTDPSDKPGSHWVLFHFLKDNVVEFFDSLGNEPNFYGDEFINFMEKFSNKYIFNKRRIQPKNSSLCGQYCILYALLCVNSLNMNETLKKVITFKGITKFVSELLDKCRLIKLNECQNCSRN